MRVTWTDSKNETGSVGFFLVFSSPKRWSHGSLETTLSMLYDVFLSAPGSKPQNVELRVLKEPMRSRYLLQRNTFLKASKTKPGYS